jgi:hypothetical protein
MTWYDDEYSEPPDENEALPVGLMWTCADGTKMLVREMTDQHLHNAIGKFQRMVAERERVADLSDELPPSEFMWQGLTGEEWLDNLFVEQNRRRRKRKQEAQ